MNEEGAVSTLVIAENVFMAVVCQICNWKAEIISSVCLVFFDTVTYAWRHMQYAKIHLKFYFYCTVLLLLFWIITVWDSLQNSASMRGKKIKGKKKKSDWS